MYIIFFINKAYFIGTLLVYYVKVDKFHEANSW